MRRTSRKTSIWTYYVVSVVIVLLALALLTWYSGDRFRVFFIQHLESTLEDRARLIASRIHSTASAIDVRQACLTEDSTVDIRMTVIETSGRVICDSRADTASMDNHADRPEIAAALQGDNSASSRRYSATLNADLLYIAVPVGNSTPPDYVVRAAIALENIDNLLADIQRTLTFAGLALALGALMLSAYLYRKVNPPLKDIIDGASRFSEGRFSSRLPDYDVREIAALGEAMNRMATQLEHLETIRTDFVANVSHELKTPITSIKGFVETLQDGAKDDTEDLDRFLVILSRQANRLEAIIDDLLTLSRLESEPAVQLLQVHREPLGDLLRQTRDLCEARASAKQIPIEIDAESDLEVHVDQSLVTQALTNLLDNAIKYSAPEKPVYLRAYRLESRDSSPVARIDIVDQGPGIPAEHIPRLFERFYRVDKARSRSLGGTGLGLSIVKHIVALHDGSVTVSSPTGGTGSTFHVDLPINKT
ncbi:MAG: ATP-binding protein [Pseudomonadota bacterium]